MKCLNVRIFKRLLLSKYGYERKYKMKKLTTALLFATIFGFASIGYGAEPAKKVEVKVFAAASLKAVMSQFEANYEKAHPAVDVILNTDSSGKLMNQIKEGAPCDIFFSAAAKQMNDLEKTNQVKAGTRTNVLNNQLVVVTRPDSNTAVTGLATLNKAKSFALAHGSVPVGKYTRRALINQGTLNKIDDPAKYTTQQVSDALGGIEISEQSNVSKVLAAVEEASCEVGTTYLSDTVGHEKNIKILEVVSYDIAGDIIYPAALIVNPDADAKETAYSSDFLKYITSEEAKPLYKEYGFDTNVK